MIRCNDWFVEVEGSRKRNLAEGLPRLVLRCMGIIVVIHFIIITVAIF